MSRSRLRTLRCAVPGKDQWADLLTKSFPRQRLSELVTLWGFVDTVTEVTKVAAVRAFLLCHLVQTVRAQKKDPLPLDGSFELYVMIALIGIALIAAWEVIWWIWDRCGASPTSSRSARRLRQLQEVVQRELSVQMAHRDIGPVGSASSSSSAAPAPEVIPARKPRKRTADATTQTTLAEDYVPIVEYLDRDVPVYRWHPGPIYVSPHGENFHTFSTCWGLRNVPKPRRLMFCNLCQNNQGRLLY